MPRRTGIVAATTASLIEQIGGAAKHGTLHLAPRRTFTLMSLMKAAATSRPEGGGRRGSPSQIPDRVPASPVSDA